MSEHSNHADLPTLIHTFFGERGRRTDTETLLHAALQLLSAKDDEARMKDALLQGERVEYARLEQERDIWRDLAGKVDRNG